jgi:hypothetical protein
MTQYPFFHANFKNTLSPLLFQNAYSETTTSKTNRKIQVNVVDIIIIVNVILTLSAHAECFCRTAAAPPPPPRTPSFQLI